MKIKKIWEFTLSYKKANQPMWRSNDHVWVIADTLALAVDNAERAIKQRHEGATDIHFYSGQYRGEAVE